MVRIIIIILLFIPLLIKAQVSTDFGLWGGGSYYLGELNTSTHFKSIKPAGGAFVRYNYNKRYALTGSINLGALSGNDLSSRYLYQNFRAHTFYTPFVDFATKFEFNFLPYEIGNDKHPYTLYVTNGIAFAIISYASRPYQIAVPTGLGFKFNISKHMGGGIEYTFRKTFTDYIDRMGGSRYYIENSPSYFPLKQKAYLHDNDWYSMIGFFISYNIPKSGVKCHTYDN
ncbi:MAG: DUF6089 family protein [Bacteroidota bacterium]